MAYVPLNWDGTKLTSRDNLDYMEDGIESASMRYIGSMLASQIVSSYTILKFGTGTAGIWKGDATYANMCYVDGGYNYGFVVPENSTAICTLSLYPPSGCVNLYCEIISSYSKITDYWKNISPITSPNIQLYASGKVNSGNIIRAVVQPITTGTFTFTYKFSLFLY